MNKIHRLFGVLAIVITALVFQGCASKPVKHMGSFAKADGAQGKKLKTGLIISGAELDKYTSKHFTIVQVMFENYTDEWISMKDISLDFGNETLNKNMQLVRGKRLNSWADAMDFNVGKKARGKNKDGEKSKRGRLPQAHLLSGDFQIPPGVSIKRWVTLFLKNPMENPYFNTIKVQYKANNTKEKATIRFRGLQTQSNFQWAHPGA